MKVLLILAIFIAGILGYGYWHAATHASFHIQIDYRDNAGRAQQAISGTGIELLDTVGRVLAKGRSDDQYHYVRLIHPEVGDCQEAERSAAFSANGRNAWQQCFAQQSTWISTWAGQVRQINLKSDRCTLNNHPVTVSGYNSDWFLWWVPHPHIGGKPYTHYSLYVTVEGSVCER